MSSRPELHIAPCSYEAAKFAVERWHYSGRMPTGKRFELGVWEGGDFKGAILFSRGATPNIGSPFNLTQTEICELTRIALRDHEWPVTRMLSIALSMLQDENPGLRLAISYADVDENHHGGIYQGGNWLFLGWVNRGTRSAFIVNGKKMHPRSIGAMGGTQSLEWVRENLDPNATEHTTQGKLKYAYPLDDEMWEQLEPRAKPYPKHEDLPAPEA